VTSSSRQEYVGASRAIRDAAQGAGACSTIFVIAALAHPTRREIEAIERRHRRRAPDTACGFLRPAAEAKIVPTSIMLAALPGLLLARPPSSAL